MKTVDSYRFISTADIALKIDRPFDQAKERNQ
jgi:hypothetical protein